MAELIAESAMVVVAKAPRVGKVKTRLCPPLSYEQAAALYTGFLLDTIEIARQVRDCAVKVVCPSEGDATELAKILPTEVGYVVQQGEGLSAALGEAIEVCLEAGHRKVFCISSDNPTLPVDYLERAITSLNSTDVVLGPTEDGGYYLVGAKAPSPFLFENMVWSNEKVLAETLERAWRKNSRIQLLPSWYDLDTGQELTRFIKELPADQKQAPHTRRALQLLEQEQLSVIS